MGACLLLFCFPFYKVMTNYMYIKVYHDTIIIIVFVKAVFVSLCLLF